MSHFYRIIEFIVHLVGLVVYAVRVVTGKRNSEEELVNMDE